MKTNKCCFNDCSNCYSLGLFSPESRCRVNVAKWSYLCFLQLNHSQVSTHYRTRDSRERQSEIVIQTFTLKVDKQ